MHFPNRFGQDVGRGLLDEVSLDADGRDLIDIGVIAVGRQDDDLRRGILLENAPGCLHAIELRHRQIQHRDLRAQLERHGHGFLTIHRLTHNIEAAFCHQKRPQSFTNDGVVVC